MPALTLSLACRTGSEGVESFLRLINHPCRRIRSLNGNTGFPQSTLAFPIGNWLPWTLPPAIDFGLLQQQFKSGSRSCRHLCEPKNVSSESPGTPGIAGHSDRFNGFSADQPPPALRRHGMHAPWSNAIQKKRAAAYTIQPGFPYDDFQSTGSNMPFTCRTWWPRTNANDLTPATCQNPRRMLPEDVTTGTISTDAVGWPPSKSMSLESRRTRKSGGTSTRKNSFTPERKSFAASPRDLPDARRPHPEKRIVVADRKPNPDACLQRSEKSCSGSRNNCPTYRNHSAVTSAYVMTSVIPPSMMENQREVLPAIPDAGNRAAKSNHARPSSSTGKSIPPPTTPPHRFIRPLAQESPTCIKTDGLTCQRRIPNSPRICPDR